MGAGGPAFRPRGPGEARRVHRYDDVPPQARLCVTLQARVASGSARVRPRALTYLQFLRRGSAPSFNVTLISLWPEISQPSSRPLVVTPENAAPICSPSLILRRRKFYFLGRGGKGAYTEDEGRGKGGGENPSPRPCVPPTTDPGVAQGKCGKQVGGRGEVRACTEGQERDRAMRA